MYLKEISNTSASLFTILNYFKKQLMQLCKRYVNHKTHSVIANR